MHRYTTIKDSTEAELKDKGSKFLAYAFPVLTETEIKQYLQEVKELHPKATHHCYAYRLGTDQNNFRANDDGEPSGSAGRPILGQLDSKGLTNVFVVVVRYYGGTKLGVSGLINAYKGAANEALSIAILIDEDITNSYEISCDYENMNEMLNYVKRLGLDIKSKNFVELCTITIVLKLVEEDSILQRIKDNYKFNCKIRKLV